MSLLAVLPRPLRLAGLPDPARRAFDLLTSVRFALGQIGVLVAAALAGVFVPQLSAIERTSPQLRAAFEADQQKRFGSLAPVMSGLGLFDVFHAWWFFALLGLLALSITVCTWARARPIWRQVHRPPRAVPPRYFETAHHRYASTTPATLEGMAVVLRRNRYRVSELETAQGPQLYADRWRWTQLGTFASHLALLVFLLGGVMTWWLAKNEAVLVGEGMSAGVFAPGSTDHMQVRLLHFVHQRTPGGRDSVIESQIQVSRRGQVVATGETSINRPFHWHGYTFHQSAFSDDGAGLEVRRDDGHLLYAEDLLLSDRVAVPVISIVNSDGSEAFRGPVPQTALIQGGGSVGALQDAGAEPLTVGLALTAGGAGAAPWQAIISTGDHAVHPLRLGEQVTVGGRTVRFEDILGARAAIVSGIPWSGDANQQSLVELVPAWEQQPQRLALVLPDGSSTVMAEGQSQGARGLTYHFLGRRGFSGITVRRDPGTRFIWVGVLLLGAGLALTFYFPRRRLWVTRTEDGLSLAGVADRRTRFRDEMEALVRRADSRG